MKNLFCSLIILIILPHTSFGQFKNNTWCFGDSAGIVFHDNGSKTTFKTPSVNYRNSCSISNQSDSLLFYAVSGYKSYYLSLQDDLCVVFDRNHNIMANGDSMVGYVGFQEMTIVPHPADTNIFFLFEMPQKPNKDGCYFSVIDMSQNNGMGSVIQKNISLYQEYLHGGAAVKSGDGLSWWLVLHKSSTNSCDTFVLFNITKQGIVGPIFKKAGTAYPGSPTWLTFNSTGTKFIFMTWTGLIEEFNFDRCTGDITLARTIRQWSWLKYPFFQFGVYSPSDRFFYLTASSIVDTIPRPSIIYQIDLWASKPWKTRDTIWYFDNFHSTWVYINGAPDGKIYAAINGNPNLVGWPFPYPDSTYNMYNMNLGVINKPNKKGPACDFQPFSFYLGGARTYAGLPSNPDYGLGPLVGSPCDTITGLPNPLTLSGGSAALQTTYISEWQKLFVNAQNIKGKNCVLKIFDVNGKEVFSSTKETQPPYFTQDVYVSNLASGMYLVNLITEKEMLSAKFVKEK